MASHEVGREAVDQRDDRLRAQHRRARAGVALARLAVRLAPQRHLVERGELEQAGAQPVVEVVVGVGDLVGAVGHLRLEARLARRRGHRHRVLPVAAVLEDALARLVAEVQAAERRIALFEPVDDAQALAVVVEPAVRLHQPREHALARVAERRMAEVVREHDRLGELLVQAQRARDRARDLAGLDRVGEAVPEVVALVIDEHLGLVLEAPERARVHDPIAIALERGAMRMLGLGVHAPARRRARDRPRREPLALFLLVGLPVAQRAPLLSALPTFAQG